MKVLNLILLDIKTKDRNVEISNILNKNKEKLAGTVEKNWVFTNRIGLTELYYKNSSYIILDLLPEIFI